MLVLPCAPRDTRMMSFAKASIQKPRATPALLTITYGYDTCIDHTAVLLYTEQVRWPCLFLAGGPWWPPSV